MSKHFSKDALLYSLALWLVGYVLGIVLFFAVPPSVLGWVIMPIGAAITVWVAMKKVRGDSFKYFLGVAAVWTAIAVLCDYLFLVLVFKPADGYYKLDVYIYYALTFLIPAVVGWWRLQASRPVASGQ